MIQDMLQKKITRYLETNGRYPSSIWIPLYIHTEFCELFWPAKKGFNKVKFNDIEIKSYVSFLDVHGVSNIGDLILTDADFTENPDRKKPIEAKKESFKSLWIKEDED